MKIAIVLLTLLAALNCQTDQMVSVLDEKTFLPMTRLRYDGHTYRATNRNWLVMFQVSWCSACKATMPAWIQLSEALSKTMRNGLGSNIRMGIIDCDMNYALTQQFLIEGYPTFLYLTKDGVFKFQGFRTVEGFMDFLEGGYLAAPQVEVKELSLMNLLLQLYRKIGLTTVVIAVLIATWLAYLGSGIFFPGKPDAEPQTATPVDEEQNTNTPEQTTKEPTQSEKKQE